MQLITKAFIAAVLLVAADQVWFQGRYRNQLLDQASTLGTNFEWQMAHGFECPNRPAQ